MRRLIEGSVYVKSHFLQITDKNNDKSFFLIEFIGERFPRRYSLKSG